MKKTDLKLALLIGVICFGAGFLLVPYQMNALTSALPASELVKMPGEISIGFLSLVTSIQLFFTRIGLLAGALYGGVFEETMLRLFFVSLLVWVFIKILKRENSTFYWTAIIIAALLFALAHLPFTNLLFGGFTDLIIFRCFLLNGIGAIFFGYLYWKKGFEYAIVSHMFAHISMQLVFIPLFY